MKKFIKTVALALCLIMLICAFSACAEAEPLMTYGEKTISVNVYQFLLSRMKGTLYYYGYDVGNEAFWKTVVDMNGTTYDQYFCNIIKEQTVMYLVADVMFDEQGLSLSAEQEAKIDEIMARHLKNAGSENALNEELMQYGVNSEILREIYILEAKIQVLKEHLYGKNGEKIDVTEKEEYFNENYVGFRQIFLATYEYVIDEDRFGDQVYYTDDKHTAIAYDTVNGKTKTDEFGKPIKDVLGNPEYFTEDGKIAYDKENGVLGYLLTESGDPAVVALSKEKKAELYGKAQQYLMDCNGDYALFEEYIALYDESESNGIIYLNSESGYYATQNSDAAYFDEITNTLAELDYGECAIYESSYGYHVLCKYENEAGAYDDKKNEDAFGSFYDDLISRLFEELCLERRGEVKIDEEVFAGALTMQEIGINIKY